MIIERCCICVSRGNICERPNTVGEPKASIIVKQDGRQVLSLEPIEQCATRCAVLEMAATIGK